ncbi:MAG: DUF444 family protein [Verrucomicrobiota bacterium]
MTEDKINSSESEGVFNDFIEDHLEGLLDNIINEGDLSTLGGRDSEIVVEMDDITPPTFTYGDDQEGSGGKGNQGPGDGSEKIRFALSFETMMELLAEKLKLPRLLKEGQGKIKEVSYQFKTYGTSGVILDKKRTFKRALRTNIGTGVYRPAEGVYDVQFRHKDRRYKLPERVEKPRYQAVVFYMGDISYSTYGERLKLEKRVVNFIQQWLDYNYGAEKVEHRFFVHDSEAHEVMEEQFYTVSNAGGTYACMVFELVNQIARNEYDPETTNFYGFYFGDGEVFHDDAEDILTLIHNEMAPLFNRIGVVEVKPSGISQLNEKLELSFEEDPVVRLSTLNQASDIKHVIRDLFR